MINKNIKDINYKSWHNDVQGHLANDFQKQGYTVHTEKNIPIPTGGNKTRRRADIFIEKQDLIVEVQKSKIISKDFRERCDDYTRAGYNSLWVFHDNRWQPDSDQNPELSGEDKDIFIKWRDYDPTQERAQFIYNSARFSIIDHAYQNDSVSIIYCVPSAGQSGLMYRKVIGIEPITRVLTPKFTDSNHFGNNDRKNHNQPPEIFKGYEVVTSIITKDTIKLRAV